MPYPIVFFFYRIAYYLVRIAFFFYYRISFEGRENVPKGTAVIFASNHRSYLDPVLVAMAAPHPFNFIAKEPLFRNPVFGGFIRLMGAFPTADAKHPDYDMLSEATKRLDKRRHLTIFPGGPPPHRRQGRQRKKRCLRTGCPQRQAGSTHRAGL